jgi:hypothetical protein
MSISVCLGNSRHDASQIRYSGYASFQRRLSKTIINQQNGCDGKYCFAHFLYATYTVESYITLLVMDKFSLHSILLWQNSKV